MSPDEVRALRKGLQCTAKELAAALDLEQATVLAWEKGDLFPTKQHVDRMRALAEKGPTAIARKARGVAANPMVTLRDVDFWTLVRKLAAHKKLRDEVAKIAAPYADPADED